ncbi:unnamed protein product [Fraxinus pennsylvanica]|uniref:RING-type domain-containing protein n=1 Tax=Fraxinus pennsylvanica TaxID=56036 RepID=A0AAD2AFE4_9LAMI|nr:unnamed protein product [Fraxinus pennsylvanica]
MYQLSSSDGSFLTLGIGGNAETMSSSNFRNQDVTSKLEGTLSFRHNSQGDLAVSPLPCSSTSIVHPDYTSVTALPSESSKPTLFARQPISNKKHNYFTRSSMNVSSDSSMNSHFLRHQGGSIRHAQLGKLIPQSGGSSRRTPVIDTVPSSLNVKPMGKQIPLSVDRTRQVTDCGPFPVRAQPSNLLQTQKYRSIDYPQKAVGLPLAIGVGSCNDGLKFSLFTAQVIPVPKVGIQSQASKVSMIRRENGNSLSAPLSQCKRMIPQPARPPSVPHQQRCIPAPISARPPFPASPLHIKWQGDEPPKTIEQKCYICKRDLSFMAEGPVYLPAVPPFVAVLPCGHTFHDHCLQTITPQDQSKNPPCIPCAIGET